MKKAKRFLSVILSVAFLFSLSMVPTFAEDEKGPLLIMPSPEKAVEASVSVKYNGEPMSFDVNPIIEDGRTLVPFRAIFEIMGCDVDYVADETGVKTVMARRCEDLLMLNIGELKIYFNGEEKAIDVPAKIKDGRTLVPIRAISEAFLCEVLWDDATKTVSINSPKGEFAISTQKYAETITDDDSEALIKIVAYYPVIDNPDANPAIDEINGDLKLAAEAFVADGRSRQAEAQALKEQMGEAFVPFAFSLTFEPACNEDGIVSIKTHAYMSTGGVHPTTTLAAYNYDIKNETELSLSMIIDEKTLETGLSEYVYSLFEQKLKEFEMPADESGKYDALAQEVYSVNYYLTKDSVVLYFNQGDIAPYALGLISVELPLNK